MNNLKRALASILAVAMLATSTNLSFAAKTNYSDVDSKYSTAVTRLSSIDILKGYEDGTFKPEGTITRAEAAAVMVRMLGKEKLASYSAGLTQFSDMTTSHWANGYVNVAAGAGLVKGYPDGSFKPEEKVTYAEVVTMMVRALGAGEAVGVQGTWPSNYLNFALVEGLTDDVAVVPNAPATRGDVAVIGNSTLDAQLWKATGYNTDGTRTYAKYDDKNVFGDVIEKTLFTEKLDLEKHEMFTITAALSVNDGDYKFSAGKDGDEPADGVQLTEGNEYKFAEGMEVPLTIGEEVDFWTNDDDEVVMIQHAKDSKQKEVNFVDVTDNNSTKIKVKLADGTEKSYTYSTAGFDVLHESVGTVPAAAKAEEINDGVPQARGTASESLDLPGSLLLDNNGKVKYVNTYKYDDAIVVDEVKFDEDDNKYTIKSDSDLPRTYTNPLVYELDKEVVYVNNEKGQAISLADVKPGDMLLFAGANQQFVVVYPATKVEGNIDSEDSDAIEVDGKEYKVGPNFESNDDAIDTFEVDDTVTLYLDPMGQIAMLDKTTGSESAGEYGIITDFYRENVDGKGKNAVKINIFDLETGMDTGVKVFDAKNTDEENDKEAGSLLVTADFYDPAADLGDGNSQVDGSLNSNAALNDYSELVGKVVKYDVDTDKVTIYSPEVDKVATGTDVDADVSKEKFVVNTGDLGSYYVESDSVKVYQADDLDDGALPVKTVAWSTLKDQDAVHATFVDLDDEHTAKYVFFYDKNDTVEKTNSDNLGVISNVKELTGGDIQVTVVTKDGSKTFKVADDEADEVFASSIGAAANANDLRLDKSSDRTKFEGLLVAYTDIDGFVTKENIQFSNRINVAKLNEVTDRNDVEMLSGTATTGVNVTKDKFEDMLVLEADITPSNLGVALTDGDFTDSTAVITVTAKPLDGQTVVVDGVTYEFDTDATAAVEEGNTRVDIRSAANVTDVATALAAAIDADSDVAATNLAGVVTITTAATDKTLSVTNLSFDDVDSSELSSIATADDDINTFAEAQDEEVNTVYYYLIGTDDGAFDTMTGTDSVAVMLFNPDEF